MLKMKEGLDLDNVIKQTAGMPSMTNRVAGFTKQATLTQQCYVVAGPTGSPTPWMRSCIMESTEHSQ